MANWMHILDDINAERRRLGSGKFGEPAERGYTLHKWLSVLAEEFGEAAAEVNHVDEVETERDKLVHQKRLRTELVQTAAVAIAFLESLDKNELGWRRVKEIELFGSLVIRCPKCDHAAPCGGCVNVRTPDVEAVERQLPEQS